MAKMIKINFSSKDKVIKFNDIGEKPLSYCEKSILDILFMMAMNNQKSISQSFECKDCIDQIKNLSEDADSIEFTEKDIDYLNQGYSLIKEKPLFWMEKCSELFKQIDNSRK